MKFTDQLVQAAEPAWTQATRHRFTRELADGTIDHDVMRRYLVQDYAFISTLVSMIGYGVAKAPDMPAKKRLSEFLAALTSDENTYFLRSFQALNVPEEDQTNPTLLPVSQAFLDNLNDAGRHGEYGDIVATLLAAEWVYLTWGLTEADKQPDAFWCREWIDLHANPVFEEFVNWLKDQVDQLADQGDQALNDRMTSRFLRMVDLEVAFFDAAYTG